MAIIVYKFRVPWWWTKRDMPAVVDAQLRLAHQLRNELVTIELEHEQVRADIYATVAEVAQAQRRLDQLDERQRELHEKVQQEKSRQRTRTPKHPAVDQLAEIRREARAARAEVRAARKAAERNDDIRARLKDAARTRDARVKATYHAYCQAPPAESRLYHATWTDVVDHHRTAVQRVISLRAQGRPAQLRRRRFDGSGTLTVQLARQQWAHGCAPKGPPWPCNPDATRAPASECPARTPKDPARTPKLLASGEGKWRNLLQIPQGKKYGHALMRIGPGPISIPISVDHEMDPDADITLARLTIRRIAGQRRATLQVTARVPDPEPVTDGPVIAVHCGWRRERDESVRVATWRTSEPVTMPDHLTDVAVQTTATTGHVVMSGKLREHIAGYDDLQSIRDTHLDDLRDQLADWLDNHPQGELTGTIVRRWRAPGRFAQLAIDWRDNPPPGGQHIADALEQWRRRDRHLWEWHDHGRQQALARRDDGYRRFAAWIAHTAGAVILDDTDLASLARTDQRDDLHPDAAAAAAAAARQRVDAAPGYLRQVVRQSAQREGVHVLTVPSAGLSATCYRCGHDDNDTSSRTIECAGCGRRYDRDETAVLHMLRRASTETAT